MPVELIVKEIQSKFDFDAIADRYDLWYESAEGAMYDHLEKKAISKYLPKNVKGMKLKAISKYLPKNVKGMKLLEIGCGTGHWSQFFSEYDFEVTGIDVSERMIKIAQSKDIPNASFQMADGQSLPFGDYYNLGIRR